MKIMHLIGYFQPELGYQEYYLAREQVKEGHQVYCVTSDLIYPFKDAEQMLFKLNLPFKARKRKSGYSVIDGIKVYRLPHVFEISDFILALGLKNIIKKIKPDVIHAHEVRQGLPALAGFYKNKFGFKYLIDQHDYGFSLETGHFLSKLEYLIFRKLIIDYALKRADKIVAIFDKGKEFLIKKHKISKDKIKIIPLAADTEIYKFNNDDRIKIRNNLNIPAHGIVFLFSGSAVPYKKIHYFIRAFVKLSDQYEDIYLILICGGNQNYINYLKNLASKAKKKDCIVFLDFMSKEKLPEYYSCADVGVFPGKESISILEQMACKLAIICPDLKTARMFIQGNGIFYNEITESSMYKAMEKLIVDEKLRLEMRENSLKLIETKFNWKKISQIFLNEYNLLKRERNISHNFS